MFQIFNFIQTSYYFRWSNTQEPGKYVYRIGSIDGTIADPDQYNQNEVEVEEESKSCALSGPSVCHTHARCVDYQAGICCQCNEGFYGNGKSCIKDDIPLRVHGNVNGILNNVHINDVNIQAYVVVADGRAYTALALAPPNLGRSLQLLNVLGGVVGWLFAKPSGNAKNGYQLTGAIFNHTADIWFPSTNDRVTIHQEYEGHDVFDQITISTDIRGTVPEILYGSKLELFEYEEQYTIVEPGLVRSEASRTLLNKETNEKYLQKVSQTFTYIPCRYSPSSPESQSTSTLKVNKNYVGYEVKENIVRYGTSNKIVPFDLYDPCASGQNSCNFDRVCVVRGETFDCVCKTGYQASPNVDGTELCLDFDECSAGTHNCDPNADCYNREGGFDCVCREGYEGNGVTCKARNRCDNIRCDSNAQCQETQDGPICICAPGYTGDGATCWEVKEQDCARCSVNARCTLSNGDIFCECYPGFSGNGFQCQWVGYSAQTTDYPPQNNYPSSAENIEVVSQYPDQSTTQNYYTENSRVSSETTSVPTTVSVTETQTPVTPPYQNTEYPYNPQASLEPVNKEAEYNETFVLPECNSEECSCPPGYSNFTDELNNELCHYDGYPVSPQSNEENLSKYNIIDLPRYHLLIMQFNFTLSFQLNANWIPIAHQTLSARFPRDMNTRATASVLKGTWVTRTSA